MRPGRSWLKDGNEFSLSLHLFIPLIVKTLDLQVFSAMGLTERVPSSFLSHFNSHPSDINFTLVIALTPLNYQEGYVD